MRGHIIDTLFERMHTNEDIFFLTADMGINLVEKIQESFPSRYSNVGIAEQNLIGVSAGLCNAGFRPFAYTISNFLVHRCFEQIRNDISLHDYPVVLLGTSAGFDNAPLGPTHHIINDWGPLRAIPGIDVYCPMSVPFCETLVDKLLRSDRPAYVRIPKGTFEEPASDLDTVYLESSGRNILLVTYGGLAQACLSVADDRKDVSFLGCNKVFPLDEDALRGPLSKHATAIVVEDHFPSTGLYNLLCQFCFENGITCDLKSIAPPDEFTLLVGSSADYYNRMYSMDSSGIVEVIDHLTD